MVQKSFLFSLPLFFIFSLSLPLSLQRFQQLSALKKEKTQLEVQLQSQSPKGAFGGSPTFGISPQYSRLSSRPPLHQGYRSNGSALPVSPPSSTKTTPGSPPGFSTHQFGDPHQFDSPATFAPLGAKSPWIKGTNQFDPLTKEEIPLDLSGSQSPAPTFNDRELTLRSLDSLPRAMVSSPASSMVIPSTTKPLAATANMTMQPAESTYDFLPLGETANGFNVNQETPFGHTQLGDEPSE